MLSSTSWNIFMHPLKSWAKINPVFSKVAFVVYFVPETGKVSDTSISTNKYMSKMKKPTRKRNVQRCWVRIDENTFEKLNKMKRFSVCYHVLTVQIENLHWSEKWFYCCYCLGCSVCIEHVWLWVSYAGGLIFDSVELLPTYFLVSRQISSSHWGLQKLNSTLYKQ